MGKRLKRILFAQLPNSANSLIGNEAHIVLTSGKTYFGNIIDANHTSLTLLGKGTYWYNRARHTHLFPFTEIQEVVLQVDAIW
jgi:hypothetical protein